MREDFEICKDINGDPIYPGTEFHLIEDYEYPESICCFEWSEGTLGFYIRVIKEINPGYADHNKPGGILDTLRPCTGSAIRKVVYVQEK